MEIYATYGLATLVTVALSRNYWVGSAFIAFAAFIVAFRFETGFDWPVYKTMFTLAKEAPLFDLSIFSGLYSGEPLFALMLGAFAKTGASYELAQFTFSILFLSSLFFLGANFSKERLFAFLALALSYIVFTVGFSTVRQSISISIFIFAFIFLDKRVWISIGLMVLSVLFHYSSIIYVSCLVFSLFSIRFDKGGGAATFFGVLALVFFSSASLYLIAYLGILPGGERVEHYVSGLRSYVFSKWDLMFGIIFLGIASHVLLSEFIFRISEEKTRIVLIARMVLVLAAVSVASIAIPIVRERVSYLLWIFYALFLTQNDVLFRRTVALLTVAFGLFFSVIAHLRYPNSLMFLPYQNSVIGPPGEIRSGSERYSEFIVEHNKLLGIH